jgi:hypothetical protein
MLGFYLEAGYNVLHGSGSGGKKLVPFARYENYNTHHSTEGGLAGNPAFNRTDLTFGLGYWFTREVAIKADYQRFMNEAGSGTNQLNMGIAFMF